MNKDYVSLIHCYAMLTENELPLRDSQLIGGLIRSHKHVFLVNHSKLWIIFYTSTSEPVFRPSAAVTSFGSEAENFTCATTTSSWQGMSRGKLASNPLQCLMVQLKQRYLRYLSFIPLGQTIRNNLIKTDASVGKKSQAYPLTNKATFAKLYLRLLLKVISNLRW